MSRTGIKLTERYIIYTTHRQHDSLNATEDLSVCVRNRESYLDHIKQNRALVKFMTAYK
jgi:hypothetical protein